LRAAVGWVAQLASEGYLLNIDSRVPQSDLSDYLGAPLSYDTYNGHLYGLPQVTDFLALLYNKAQLEKAGIATPPATMADFETAAKKVVQSKSAKYGFETNGTAYDVLPFFYAFGGGMLGPNDESLVADDGSVNGLKFLLRLQNTDNVMPKNVNFSIGPITPTVSDFAAGRTAMIFGGPYDVSQILTGSSFEGNPGNLGIARIPTCPPGTPTCRVGQTGSPLGGQSYVITAGTAHPIEAYEFISFMSSRASQIAIATANYTLPTRQSAYRELPDERFLPGFYNIAKTAIALPPIPQAGHLFDAFDPHIAAVLDNVETPKYALNSVANAWKQLLTGPIEASP
jgi:arabinogalactan oligomer/maltooligosaccharide transport system substrate-binding protein